MTAQNPEQQFRIEHDTMGEVKVPIDALYRAQTQRAVENFPISGKGLEPAHIHALAQVKKAAAKANQELGVLDAQRAEAIRSAADRVAAAIRQFQSADLGVGVRADQYGVRRGAQIGREHAGIAVRPHEERPAVVEEVPW